MAAPCEGSGTADTRPFLTPFGRTYRAYGAEQQAEHGEQDGDAKNLAFKGEADEISHRGHAAVAELLDLLRLLADDPEEGGVDPGEGRIGQRGPHDPSGGTGRWPTPGLGTGTASDGANGQERRHQVQVSGYRGDRVVIRGKHHFFF